LLSHAGTYRRGEEGGSARWADPRELLPFADRTDASANILLTKNVSIALKRTDHDVRYERNRNVNLKLPQFH
jgi:type IV secretion system protein VirD4